MRRSSAGFVAACALASACHRDAPKPQVREARSSAAPTLATSSGPKRAAESVEHGSVLVAEAFLPGNACVRQSSGAVLCWAWANQDTIPGLKIVWPTPTRVPELENAVHVAHAVGFTYVLRKDGTLWRWGIARDQTAFGKAVFKDASVPERVEGLPPLQLVSSDSSRVFAFGRDNSVYSWREQYEINDDQVYTAFKATPPVKISWLPPAKAASSECYAGVDGTAFCVEADNATVLPGSAGTEEIHRCTGREFGVCARTSAGAILCWQWKPGQPEQPPRQVQLPVLPRASQFNCVADGLQFVSDGAVYYWDRNMGDAAPIAAAELKAVREIAGYCVLQLNGVVGCYGSSLAGRIGKGEWPSQFSAKSFTAEVEPLRIGVNIAKPDAAP